MTVKEDNPLTLLDISRQMGIKLSQDEIATNESETSEYVPEIAEHPPDSQPVARKPQLKFILILLGVSAVVGLFSLFMLGGGAPQSEIASPQPTPEFVDDKDAEIAKLKSKASIEAQKQALSGNPTPQPTPTPTPSAQPTSTPTIAVPDNDNSASPGTVPTASPPIVKRSGTGGRMPVTSNPRSPRSGTPSYNPPITSNPIPPVAPNYHRRQLQPVAYSPSPNFSPPSRYSQRYPREPASVTRSLARSPTTSSGGKSDRRKSDLLAKQQQEIDSLKQQLSQAQQNQKVQPTVQPVPTPNPKPTIEPVEPAGQPETTPPEPVIPPPILAIGSRVRGKLMNPLQISRSKQGEQEDTHQIFVQTIEPITTTGNWQIPEGAVIAFKVNVADSGLVTGESLGVWYGNHPVKIPAGALSLSSPTDAPLIAQTVNPYAKAIARADRETILWSTVGQVGRTLSAPDSQISINNGGSVTTATNNNPNIVGAVLDGAFNSKANSSQEKAQQMRELAAQSSIWHLGAGTEVMLIANPPDPELLTAQQPTNQEYLQTAQPLPDRDLATIPPPQPPSVELPVAVNQPPPVDESVFEDDFDPLEDESENILRSDELTEVPVEPPDDCPDSWGNRSYPHVCN
jgi:hypothetical protein